uniref:Uncharacterized protein n=1 Tax=Leersia perrieri TaxID=77586 RepID=A0A0D9UXZ5_9ORYZ
MVFLQLLRQYRYDDDEDPVVIDKSVCRFAQGFGVMLSIIFVCWRIIGSRTAGDDYPLMFLISMSLFPAIAAFVW